MVDEINTGKGHATPSRREAESARKKQMKTPTSRKEQGQRERAARQQQRLRTQEAMRSGDDKYLPVRERGPVRRFIRDYVDRRYNAAEFTLLLLILALILPVIGTAWAAYASSMILSLTIVIVVLDTFWLLRGLRRELARRGFDPADTKGSNFYALLRSTQLRRFRLPKPQVKRREPLKATYR